MIPTASAPLVSVVMPAYNVAWCIGRAVDSVLAQDFRSRELIVVNDGSTDGTRAVLERYGAAITVIDQENQGMSAARNVAIRRARGTYVAFLDADDWWLPGKLRRQVELMQGSPEIGFCSNAVAGRGWRRAAAQPLALSSRPNRCPRDVVRRKRGHRRRLLGGHGAQGSLGPRRVVRREPARFRRP